MLMQLLAISGSLRAHSRNTAVLQALITVAAPKIEVVLWKELDRVPPFNPDLEALYSGGPVGRFRTALRDADAIVFSTPEYAHGIPGSLKNALDWVVGSGELSKKPVVLLNASSRGEYAQAALKEVLRAMDARVLADAEVTVDLQGKTLSGGEIAETPEFAALLTSFLQKVRKEFSSAQAQV